MQHCGSDLSTSPKSGKIGFTITQKYVGQGMAIAGVIISSIGLRIYWLG